MLWQSIEEVRLKLTPLGAKAEPLAAHKDWINAGGAVRRVTDDTVLVVHQTKTVVTVLRRDQNPSRWTNIYRHTPYDMFEGLGWGKGWAMYVRVPTPSISQEALPDHIRVEFSP